MMAIGSVQGEGFMNMSTSANLRIALTTPMSAPPAMNPDAISVPFSMRASFVALSWLRVLTNHEMAPPTSIGMLRSRGMNMPSAKGSAGILKNVSTRAMRAPIPYRSHGALPPFIIGSMTAAMALACGATRAPSPVNPYVLLRTSITPPTVAAATRVPRNFQLSCF